MTSNQDIFAMVNAIIGNIVLTLWMAYGGVYLI